MKAFLVNCVSQELNRILEEGAFFRLQSHSMLPEALEHFLQVV